MVKRPDGSGCSPSGIWSEFYYRHLYTDAVRAVEAARSHPLVDAARAAVLGVSQGGGIALAVGGLVPDLAAVAPDVPFLCDFPRAVTLTDRIPYREVGHYLKTHRGRVEQVARTLAYFDGVHFAARGRVPALFSVALEDLTCPPSTVFAALNAYGHADREIEVYAFNDHEVEQAGLLGQPAGAPRRRRAVGPLRAGDLQ